MNKTELDESLQFLNESPEDLEIVVYACLKDIESPLRLDIKFDDLPDIKQMFLDSIRFSIIDKEDYSVLPLSTADERGKCFYSYDLDLPEELEHLENIIGNDNLTNFDFRSNQLAEIESLIIVIANSENEVSLYKKISPVEVIGRGGYMLWKANQRFEKFNDQLLRISPKFQAIRVNEEVIIINLEAIEKSFGFQDVIVREASVSVESIDSMQIVSNIESLQELVSDVSFARKLTRVARSSPVIRLKIPNEHIISFSKNHPATKNRMRYTEDETQFQLDTRVSKDLFIKLLNDDFLTSELTRLYYASLAKDGIEVDEEAESVAEAVMENNNG